MLAGPRFTLFLVLLSAIAGGCASPTEKAMKLAMRDYELASAASADYAKQVVADVVTVARAFHDATGRWPASLAEVVVFSERTTSKIDPFAFNDTSFATLPDGSLQLYYDVNCARFNTPQYKFRQASSVNVKAP